MSTLNAVEEIEDIERCVERVRARLVLIDPDSPNNEVDRYFEQTRPD